MDLFMVEIVPRETLLAIQAFHSDRFQTLTFLIPTLLFPWMLWFSLSLLPTRKWLYKIPMLGKIKGKRRRGRQMLDDITDSTDLRGGEGPGNLACCSPQGGKQLDATR
jgi:hypothetical protein